MERQIVNAVIGGPERQLYFSIYKTVIVKGNFSLKDLIISPNTKYIIKHNFDLKGETLEIPENCLIEFDGGSISNGTIIGNDTIIISYQENDVVFKNIDLQGTFTYTRLNQSVINEIYSEINNRVNKVDYQQDKESYDETLTQHGDTLTSYGNELTEHEETLTQHGDTLTSYGNELTEHEETLTSHSDTLESYGDTLESYGNELTEHGNTLESYGNTLTEHNDILQNITLELSSDENYVPSEGKKIVHRDKILKIKDGLNHEVRLNVVVVDEVDLGRYTVTFNTMGGDQIPSQIVLEGNSISLPTPIYSDKIFKGWYSNSNFTGTQYSGIYTPTGDITFYAKWEDKAKYYYYLSTSTMLPNNFTFNTLAYDTTTLGNLVGWSNWKGQENQYIVVPSKANTNNVADYIDIRDTLTQSSLLDDFEIVGQDLSNIVMIKQVGFLPLGDSDSNAIITFK